MNLYTYFKRCLNVPYISVENNGDYFTERKGSTLYIYFECSNGREDWKNNLDFLPSKRKSKFTEKIGTCFKYFKNTVSKPEKPYEDMEIKWRCHRGFLKVFKSIKPHIENEIKDENIKKIITIGYSHGAAVAVLCHEYIWFERPDLRDKILGYGYGCPRVYFGFKKGNVKKRWENFYVIRNKNDLVTHLPPVIFGFSHVGNMIKIGRNSKYSMIDAHKPENILKELKKIHK